MMRPWRRCMTVMTLGLLLAGSVPAVAADDDVAARVGERVITRKELDRRLAISRIELERQWHVHSLRVLEELIQDSLLLQEAARRGISMAELLRQEVDEKSRAIGDGEVTDFIQLNQRRIPAGSANIQEGVRQVLQKQARETRQREFLKSLRATSPVDIRLAEPLPPAAAVGTSGAGALGPGDAAITIVEFSDFQCPYCRTVQSTLKQLRERHGTRLRIVYRDMPIVEIHPGAVRAAEAARCAADQGRFWEYHDILFANQDKQAPDDLLRHAKDLGLAGERFETCLANRQFREAVEADIAEAKGLGVSSTPTFFVNGRPLVGAQPIESFERVIGAELANAKR